MAKHDIPEEELRGLFTRTEELEPEKEEEEGRKTPLRPSEERRRDRQLAVTFSTANIPDRIRALALKWKMYAPDKESPAVSQLVEYLLTPRLEAAENGEIEPPTRA